MKNIIFRKQTAEDSIILSEWFNNKENVKYMSSFVRCNFHDPESIRLDMLDEEGQVLFMVCLENGKPIGNAGIDCIDHFDKRGEIFLLIGDPEEKGKGYGCRIISFLVEHAFDSLNLNSLFATASIDNYAAISVLEKNGFKKIGIRRGYNFLDGKFMDEVFFDMTKEDYINLKIMKTKNTKIQTASSSA